MVIRLADELDFESIMNNYKIMSEAPGQLEAGAGWVVGIYPDDEMIKSAIANNEYFVVEEEGTIYGGMSLNTEFTEGYEKVKWKSDAQEGEFLSIHALGVMPEARGRGFAKQLVHFAIDYAKKHFYKAIRIDVYAVNVAAKKLYPSLGFDFVDQLELYYEDTGLADYLMYEYIV